MAKKEQLIGRSDMSASPAETSYEPQRINPPTPMTDAVELSNVEPVGKAYRNKKQMKYGGNIVYTNGPRKVRR